MALNNGSDSTLGRGSTDTFETTAADVGDLSHLILKLAPNAHSKGLHSGWKLKKVDMQGRVPSTE